MPKPLPITQVGEKLFIVNGTNELVLLDGTKISMNPETPDFLIQWNEAHKAGLNQSEFAAKLGITRQALSSRKKTLEKKGYKLPSLSGYTSKSLAPPTVIEKEWVNKGYPIYVEEDIRKGELVVITFSGNRATLRKSTNAQEETK